jgi:hypothetical protein
MLYFDTCVLLAVLSRTCTPRLRPFWRRPERSLAPGLLVLEHELARC